MDGDMARGHEQGIGLFAFSRGSPEEEQLDRTRGDPIFIARMEIRRRSCWGAFNAIGTGQVATQRNTITRHGEPERERFGPGLVAYPKIFKKTSFYI